MMNDRVKKELRSLLGALLLTAGFGLLVLLALWLWKPDVLWSGYEVLPDWVEQDGSAADAGPDRALRVLFIGNSHTYMNDMPEMVRQLAQAAGAQRRFLFLMEAPGGSRLKDHWDRGRAARLLDKARWDFVVLQEQQQFLGFAREQRATDSNPYASHLVAKARAKASVPVLFQTWGRRDGDQYNFPDDTYQAMQARVRQGYRELAEELAIEVVPVGDAWEKALKQSPQPSLWADDGSHASRGGSYLAACMFYAVFYRQSPVGNSYSGGLAESEAKVLQEVAAATVAR